MNGVRRFSAGNKSDADYLFPSLRLNGKQPLFPDMA